MFKKWLMPLCFLLIILSQHSWQTVRSERPLQKVLLISVDTLRPDFLGTYRAEMNDSPNLDQFASQNVVFSNVTSQAPSTLISHKSIFYSLYPSIHKTTNRTLPEELLITPLQTLQQIGFQTAAFVGGGELNRKFGLAKGFGTYWEAGTYSDTDLTESLDTLEHKVIEWLETNHDQKFFLFLHTYEMHCPYYPPKKYRDRFAGWYKGDIDPRRKCGDNYYNLRNLSSDDLRFVRDLYSAQLAFVDNFIGNLFNKLKNLNIYDETLIIFLSDHGESLGERGYVGHNQLYKTQLHVPLIFHIPGISALQIESPVEALDIMPTVFNLLNLKSPYRFQGRDLMPLVLRPEKGEAGKVLFSEQSGKVRVQKGPMIAIFAQDQNESAEVYDQRNDPMESINVAKQNSEFLRSSKQAYLKMRKDWEATASKFVISDPRDPKLDEDTKAQLMGLGYIR